MASDKCHHPQVADFHEPMPKKHPENQMARSCIQRRTLKKNKTSHFGDGNKKRKWGWIGHTLRKPAANITRQALDWNPQEKRKVCRPEQTWWRNIETEAKATGMT